MTSKEFCGGTTYNRQMESPNVCHNPPQTRGCWRKGLARSGSEPWVGFRLTHQVGGLDGDLKPLMPGCLFLSWTTRICHGSPSHKNCTLTPSQTQHSSFLVIWIPEKHEFPAHACTPAHSAWMGLWLLQESGSLWEKPLQSLDGFPEGAGLPHSGLLRLEAPGK